MFTTTKILPSDEGYPSTGGDGANGTVAGEGEIVRDKAEDNHLDSDNRLAKKKHFGEEDNRRRHETMENGKFDTDSSRDHPNSSAKEDILLAGKIPASCGVSKDSEKEDPHTSRRSKQNEHDGSTTPKHEDSLHSMELHAGDGESSVATSCTLAQRSGTHRLARPSWRNYARESKMLLDNADEYPLKVPGAVFMEHPAESEAAKLLKRHDRRVEDVRAKQEKVGELMKLVMDHDPDISESPLPDIDKVFPTNRSSDKLQSDFRV